jgi:hypothetical protein
LPCLFSLPVKLAPNAEDSGHEQDFHQRVANMDSVAGTKR